MLILALVKVKIRHSQFQTVEKLVELLKFCEQSDFTKSCRNIFFFLKTVKELKFTHAQPTQKRNILL